MLTVIYCIVSIWVFFKLMGVLLKATWGLTKFIVGLVFWSIVIAAALIGLIWLALPILIVVGILTSVVRV